MCGCFFLSELLKEECSRKEADVCCTHKALSESQAATREAVEHAGNVESELERVKRERDSANSLLKETQSQLKLRTDFSMQCMDQELELEVTITNQT